MILLLLLAQFTISTHQHFAVLSSHTFNLSCGEVFAAAMCVEVIKDMIHNPGYFIVVMALSTKFVFLIPILEVLYAI